MEETVKERLIKFLKHENIGQVKFADTIGVSSGFVANIRKSIQPDKIKKIAKCYPNLNTGWLLTGEGDMLKKEANNDINITGSYGVSVGDNNRSTYSNIGNSYNFALPEKGHAKIIRPDGTVSTESYDSDIENRLAELEALREKIVVLDKLVKSLEEQIDLYKMKIDMLEHRQ